MATALDAAAIELANSLTQDEIPTKLRCATCNKFAFGAVKLPCCDQSICDSCHSTLPEQCPICEHSPLAADECRPNKSLRLTIKAFLKSEEKKRTKESAPTPITPVVEVIPEPAAVEAPAPADIAADTPEATDAQGGAELELPADGAALAYDGAQDDQTATTTDIARPGEVPVTETEQDEEDEDDEDEDDVVIHTERPEGDDQQEYNDADHNGSYEDDGHGDGQGTALTNGNQRFGFHQNPQNFNGGDFSGMNGFNPMMAMGMPGFMGMPNMMGMPGMNMDPSMMFGGGFGGMDMAMMSMGMGMGLNGFGGMPGMGMNGSAGFFPGQAGGYNNSNFGSNMNQNFRNDRGFGGRPYGRGGYGRGRGYNNYGRGRGGGYGHANQNYAQNQGYMNSRQDFTAQGEGGEAGDQEPAQGGPPDHESTRDAGDAQMVDSEPSATDPQADSIDPPNGGTGNDANGHAHDGPELHREGVQEGAVATLNGVEQDYEYDQRHWSGGRGQSGPRGGRGVFRGGRGGFGGHGTPTEATELTPTPAPPVNAPTGPKAMREGKPNSGRYSRPAAQTPVEPMPQPDGGRSRHEYDRSDRGRSPTRSRSRERHGERKRRHRSYDEDYESDETYKRRKERGRRKRKERERDEESLSRKGRSREESREDSSSRRHRDKYDDYKSSRSHRDRSREKRKHRHRSRSPARGDDVNGDSERRRKARGDRNEGEHDVSDRHRDKERSHRTSRRDEDAPGEDRDRASRHSRSARKEELPSVVETQPPDDFKIKGSKSASINPGGMPPPRTRRPSHRRSSFADSPATPTTPAAASDPYAEERERRHAERVLKEQQRRQSSTTTSSLGKRMSRDEDEIDSAAPAFAPKGPRLDQSKFKKSRKERHMRVKYEGEVDDRHDNRDAERWR